MAYNSNKGPQHSGDIQYESDPNDTQIDFEDDSITLKTGGSARVVVNNTGLSGSGTLQNVGPTILGSALSVSGTLTAGNELDTKVLFSLGEFTDGFKVTSTTAEVFRIDTDASNGNTFFRGKTRIGSHTVAPTATVSVTGDVSGSGTLQAVGATILGNTLAVSGASTLNAVTATTISGSGHATFEKVSIGEDTSTTPLYVKALNDEIVSVFKSATHPIILGVTGSNKVVVGGLHLGGVLNVTGSDIDKLISLKSDTHNPAFEVSGSGEVTIAGSLRAKQISITTHKASMTSAASFIRFDSNGADTTVGSNNKMATPYAGKLIKFIARAESAPGSTVVSFHRNTDGNTNVATSPVESITVNMASADTSYTFNFTDTSDWAGGDIVGIRVDATNAPNNIVMTAVWEFNHNS